MVILPSSYTSVWPTPDALYHLPFLPLLLKAKSVPNVQILHFRQLLLSHKILFVSWSTLPIYYDRSGICSFHLSLSLSPLQPAPTSGCKVSLGSKLDRISHHFLGTSVDLITRSVTSPSPRSSSWIKAKILDSSAFWVSKGAQCGKPTQRNLSCSGRGRQSLCELW